MQEALHLLRGAVTHEWESLSQVLREHGTKNLGHPHVAGTGLWHLRHILETFRIHCAAATGGEVDCSGDIPQEPEAVRDLLLAHIDQFIAWVGAQTPRRLARPVQYGQAMLLLDIVGIMTRHITWHSAAIHYWVKWKSVEPDSPPSVDAEDEA